MAESFNKLEKYLTKKKEADMTIDEILKSRYVDMDAKSNSWRKAYIKALDDKNVEEIARLTNGVEVYFETAYISKYIDNFTMSENNRFMALDNQEAILLNQFNYYVKGVKKKDNNARSCIIGTVEGDIKVFKISEAFNLTNDAKAELECDDRKHRCHQRSMDFALNSEDGSCEIVTGIISRISNRERFVHSWIEFSDIAGEWCLDWTLNAAIDKAGYYRIHHVDESETCHIPNETLRQELPMLNRLVGVNEYFSKMYLADREGALTWYENNINQKHVTMGEG